MIEKDVKAFKQYCIGGQQCEAVKAGSGEDDYADKEELTVMEGFKYRVDDGPYPKTPKPQNPLNEAQNSMLNHLIRSHLQSQTSIHQACRLE